MDPHAVLRGLGSLSAMRPGARSRVTKCELIGNAVPMSLGTCGQGARLERWAPRAAVVIAVALVIQRFSYSTCLAVALVIQHLYSVIAVALVIQRFSYSSYQLFDYSSSKEVSRTETGSLG
jgi:hypothetical protein